MKKLAIKAKAEFFQKVSNSLLRSLCFRYVSKQKRLFFTAFLFSCVYGLMSGLGLPLIFEKVFRKVFEEPATYAFEKIVAIAVAIPLGFFIRGLFGYLGMIWMNQCSLKILADLRMDIFNKLQYLPLKFFERRTTGDLLHRVIADPKNLQDTFIEMASELFTQPLQMIAAFIGLIYLSIRYCDFVFSFIFFTVIPIYFLTVRLLRTKVKQYSRKMQQCESDVMTCVSENLQSAQEIRLFNLEMSANKKFQSKMEQLTYAIQSVLRWQKLQQPTMEIVSAIVVSVIFVYAFLNKIPFSVFSAMGTALYFAFDPIKKVAVLCGLMQRVTGSVERIAAILNMSIDIQSPAVNAYRDVSDGSFSLQNVCFSYDLSILPSLQAVTIDIPARKFYALVGRSGAGKSTFIKLLARLYDVSDGKILFGGIDVKQWDVSVLRQQIAIVSQTTVLFNDTLANNLRVGNSQVTDEEVIQAAKMAYAHDFIMASGGYEAVVGENANKFSGGQRQRLAIARAFLKKAPVLILDEATASLDSESEFFIQRALANIMCEKTVIAIAHRISTIQQADCILVLDKGCLIGEGKHKDLLKTNEHYRQLVEKQLIQTVN